MKLHRSEGWSLVEGEATAVLKVFSADRFDSVVTDPPYEIGFMNQGWDASGVTFSAAFWREVLRVLKPGAHLLAFGATRTYHRMTCAIEDAGFEVRDSLHWFYGTGFPKSLNVGEGRGTALKPGHEPVVLARKPVLGTVAANVARWGTGALNVDDCRIGTGKRVPGSLSTRPNGSVAFGVMTADSLENSGHNPNVGRWPANVLLDEAAASELDEQAPQAGANAPVTGRERSEAVAEGAITNPRGRVPGAFHADSGGASRFFYVAKPGRSERDAGCDLLPARSGGEATHRVEGSAGLSNPRAGAGRGGGVKNFHPTVKPVALMRYLVRLVTPLGGSVLDPFVGSGTTGIAARLEGRPFLGVDQNPEFIEIAKARIGGAL